MDKAANKLDTADSLAIRDKVNALLEAKGMSIMDLIRGIPMSKGGYYTMWEAGTCTLGTLVNIARVLGEPAGSLLPDRHRAAVLRSEPGARPYVEDRLEQVEREVRSLRNELKNQMKKR